MIPARVYAVGACILVGVGVALGFAELGSALEQRRLSTEVPEHTLLPERFTVYVDPGGTVARYPFSGSRAVVLPTVNRSADDGGCYVAVYTHRADGSAYRVSARIYVAGQIRVRGSYVGRICTPEGMEGIDISASRQLQDLARQTFPRSGPDLWVGGDTGGWFGRN